MVRVGVKWTDSDRSLRLHYDARLEIGRVRGGKAGHGADFSSMTDGMRWVDFAQVPLEETAR